MNANQNMDQRSFDEKLEKQTQGVLAEIAVHIFLEKILNFDVLRFDLERETFQYNPMEYDLKIKTSNKKSN